MYDISGFRPQNKETAFAIRLAVILLVAVFCAGYCIGLRNAGRSDAGSVPDHGTGIDHVREQYQHIEIHQREITDGIGSSEKGAARIEGGIQHVAESVEQSAAAVGDAGRLINESQQILGRVRNRGQAGTTPN